MLETPCPPESLLIVRSTLEVASLLRFHYPELSADIAEIEAEVKDAGQSLIVAGSVVRARVALARIHRAQLALEELKSGEIRLAA